MRRHDRTDEALVEDLCAAAHELWRRFEARTPGYHTYVHADWPAAVAPLRQLKATCHTFLECGSGLGVVTILADLIGFDAYGIELDPWLFARSLELSERFGASATFAQGSFLPAAARDEAAHVSSDFLTVRDGEPAYAELGMTLEDFDVLYAFPWPGEEERFLELARAARRDTRVLLYGAADGYQLFRRGPRGSWLRA